MTRPSTIIAHVAGWVLFVFLIGGFTIAIGDYSSFFELIRSPDFLFFLLIYGFIFYLNGYYLFPALFRTKNYIAYFLIIAALAVLVYFLKPFDRLLGHGSRSNKPPQSERLNEGRDDGPPPHGPNGNDSLFNKRPPPDRPPRNGRNGGGPSIDIVGIVLFVMACSISSVIPLLKQWRATEQRALRAEADKANAELSFLRAQVNPHFLFNTLNNIYTLVVTNNHAGPQAIMKLSHMLRYITDEATQDNVLLEKEIACISNYIALQQLRLDKNVMVDFSVHGTTARHKLPPLLLMTFVENVFKYGISSHEQTNISIAITVSDSSIRFVCRNKIFNGLPEAGRKGIGIDNAKKRLNFLYPHKHWLYINNEDGFFTVTLDLETVAA